MQCRIARMIAFSVALLLGVAVLLCGSAARADDLATEVGAALTRAGGNRAEIQKALDNAPADEREGMRFLVAYMPERDLTTLKADFLLENVSYAYRAFREAKWKDAVPKEVFFNYVLPYANLNERRDNWRKDFYEKFRPLVVGIDGSGKAGAKLNDKVFTQLKVRFSKQRPKVDQSPYETIQCGMATCTGLSLILVDACRAVGVPARFVGTPQWTDMSGNHSWVEIWDNGGWHYTGAAEAYGDKLDVGWFNGRAAGAVRDDLIHAIYAASYKPTGQIYPLLWAQDAHYVYATNVTDRYAPPKPTAAPAAESVPVRFVVLDQPKGQRLPAKIALRDAKDKVIFEGVARDERFDPDDELKGHIPAGHYRAEIRLLDRSLEQEVEVKPDAKQKDQRYTFCLAEATRREPGWLTLSKSEADFVRSEPGKKIAAVLKQYFDAPTEKRADMAFDPALDKYVLDESAAVRKMAWGAYRTGSDSKDLLADLKAHKVTYKEFTCPYVVRPVGTMPKGGWPLFIAMHGGGGAPQELNDSQWRQMQIYYRDQPTVEGYLYLAIRAPNNAWNGFYDWYNLVLTDKLIREMLLTGEVDPNKIFLMGYSHGGYGAFFIGPQIADHFAAVHASAAAPATGNEVGKNLRNTPFTYMIGEKDTMYGRFGRCQDFKKYMDTVRGQRQDIYPVTMQLIPGAPHGGLPDRDKIKDMYPAVRNPVPRELTWLTSYDVVTSFSWLRLPKSGDGREVTEAICRDNKLTLKTQKIDELSVLLDQRLVDYAKPLAIDANGEKSTQELKPSLKTLCQTLAERGDPELMFVTRLVLKIKPRAESKK